MPSNQSSLRHGVGQLITDEELAAVHGGVKSKGEEMCEFTGECEQSQSRLA